MKTVKVHTTVVTYNPYKSGFFPTCAEKLRELVLHDEEVNIEHLVTIIDNSPDRAVSERIKNDFPWVDVVKPEGNTGYAGGNNIGLKQALSCGAEYASVVTQDVYVEPDWLLESVKTLEKDESIGVLQPLLLLANKPGLVNSTGNQIHFLGYGYAGDYLLPEPDAPKKMQYIPYFSGAVIVFRVKALQEVGLFDEEMWMYNEDEDLGWRMWLKGYTNAMAPQARAYHEYEFSRSITKMYYMDRNRLIVVLQNYHWLTLVFVLPVLIPHELASLLLAFKGGWWREKLASMRYFLKPASWRLILRKRRIRQQGRLVKDRDIVKRFTGKILFQDVMNPIVKYIANPILSFYWMLLKKIIIW